MDPKTAQILLGAAGSGGAQPGLYVDEVYSSDLFEGSGSSRTVTTGIDVSGEGGLVIIKDRDTAGATWNWYDTERGVNKRIKSDSMGSEQNHSAGISAFSSTGYTVGSDTDVNNTNKSQISYTFRKAPGFFDIVTYTGNGVGGRSIAHSLGSKPGMIIVKIRNTSGGWFVYHKAYGATKYMMLNNTSADDPFTNYWNDTEPTSTHFTVGSSGDVNSNGSTYVAYLFADNDQQFGTNSDEAIIKCDSYTGTGSSHVVDLGFEPQWLMIKVHQGDTDDWEVFDIMPGFDSTIQNQRRLKFNQTHAEAPGVNISLQPNGFRLNNTDKNSSSTRKYLYVAIRRSHKPPEAGTDVFAVDTMSSGNDGTPQYTSNFPVDFFIRRNNVNTTDYPEFLTRATNSLSDPTANSSFSDTSDALRTDFAYMNGFSNSGDSDSNDIGYMFRRAAEVFDCTFWKGTGSDLTVNHNLGVVPELIIAKPRSFGGGWYIYPGPLTDGDTKHIKLASTAAVQSNSGNSWNPTATTFTADTYLSLSDNNERYAGWLFASKAGISKVGSYSGTGNNVDVDCGFTAGARFVLIKRTDSTGGWYVFDSNRGIVSGNDPWFQLQLNTQSSSTDYIDPLNAGFTITSSAPADLNASGGTYLFLAFA